MNQSPQALNILDCLESMPFKAPPHWQQLIRSVSEKEIGDVGEWYVASELQRRGLDTVHFGGSNKGFDLEVVGFKGVPLTKFLRIEVKVDRNKQHIRDTWGSWHSPAATLAFGFEYIVMMNLNVGFQIHIIPRVSVERTVYRHANGSHYSFRFGVTDDTDRRDVGLLIDGKRFSGAWSLIYDHVVRLDHRIDPS